MPPYLLLFPPSIAAPRIAERLTTTPDSGVATFQWGLQYSLLRQLQQHQEETKAMIAESSGMGKMREDLSRENMELRKFFGAEQEEGRRRDS